MSCFNMFQHVSTCFKPFLPGVTEVQQPEMLGCWDDAQVMLAQKAGEEICDLAEAECREERWGNVGKQNDGVTCSSQ